MQKENWWLNTDNAHNYKLLGIRYSSEHRKTWSWFPLKLSRISPKMFQLTISLMIRFSFHMTYFKRTLLHFMLLRENSFLGQFESLKVPNTSYHVPKTCLCGEKCWSDTVKVHN